MISLDFNIIEPPFGNLSKFKFTPSPPLCYPLCYLLLGVWASLLARGVRLLYPLPPGWSSVSPGARPPDHT